MRKTRWSRRQFTGGAAALGLLAGFRRTLAQAVPPPPRSQGDSPEILAGGLRPLLESNVARPLRYRPDRDGLGIRNGREFFNRPLYGPNIPFRVDGGDLPEFSLYLPGHGGNLRLGLARAGAPSVWLHDAAEITTHYLDGRLAYQVRDALLGSGLLRLQVMAVGAGVWVQATGEGLPPGLWLTWAFAGVSGRKGRRNGDIGCEVEPVSQFFQVRAEECRGNVWSLGEDSAEVVSGKLRLRLAASPGAELRVGEVAAWNEGWDALWQSRAGAGPALAGRVSLENGTAKFVSVTVLEGALLPPLPPGDAVRARGEQLERVTQGLRWRTPDAFLDGVAGPLALAADAIWDETQGCVMHGAVAWRQALAGWRGPYALDVVGRHDRMQRHLRHWIAKQNVAEVTNGKAGVATGKGFQGMVEATGEPDRGSAGSRTESLLHSNGDLSHNHYDMNLVFFDALLRHLRWTGDLAFAREAWPALVRHAAWERRLFRREYGTPEQTSPLYEAYAAIWASDNLQYNGGGAAHSSAYNVFLNRGMAELAVHLHEPGEAYAAEADAIGAAMRTHLWMPGRGAFAESRDWLGGRALAEDPAVWTVYHSIDSELTTPKEAWQMAADRLRAIRRIPVVGEGVPEGGWQMACSDWLPYLWSLTLLTLGENLAMALALFQAGMAQEGYGLLSGSLVDACYRGLCPGNFPMSLQLDPHRQESQRDFGDPIGCASRALVEGLWGVQPRLLESRLLLKPQLPSDWDRAELEQANVKLAYLRDGSAESWVVSSGFQKPVSLRLELPARTVELPRVTVNGVGAAVRFDPAAVGGPKVVLEAPAAAVWKVELEWHGAAPAGRAAEIVCTRGEAVAWPAGVDPGTLDDPQGCLDGVHRARRAGGFTVFAPVRQGACEYWRPLELKVREPAKAFASKARARFEAIDLGPVLEGQVTEIFTRPHDAPRSGLASLNLPEGLLGGWANFDDKAAIDDAGLRGAGGTLLLPSGLLFKTPAGSAPNCCFLSYYRGDRRELALSLTGRASGLYLLLACTTFPQATRSVHGLVRVRYADGKAETRLELRSPADWWPVEQDYLVDDYVFRLEPFGDAETPLPLRVDLRTGSARTPVRGKGGRVAGGSATVLRVELDAGRTLAGVDLSCERYGVVMGVLGITLGR